MYYPEFKKASKKHLIACECLIFSLDNDDCSQKEKHILTTIYYLAGYIFETILKFSIYSAIAFKKTDDIKSLDDHNLTFDTGDKKRRLETHKLKDLNKIFLEKHTQRLDPNNFKKCENLFYNWNSELRYDASSNFTKDEIISFFEFAENTYKKLYTYK
jgi:hypothetical protein